MRDKEIYNEVLEHPIIKQIEKDICSVYENYVPSLDSNGKSIISNEIKLKIKELEMHKESYIKILYQNIKRNKTLL